ncbi:MAG: NUDIX domain-containing protein [Dysgonomonas sp.]|nr:NUDIX domain-containing protein [Dysgonomonas sp.]
MTTKEAVKNTLVLSADSLHPGLSVDCVIFGFHEGTMKILLNKFSSYTQWMLPGGFVFRDEDVEDAAYRVLGGRTGLKKVYLQQFHSFGSKNRTRLSENSDMLTRFGYGEKEIENHWLMQRFVSIGYYALVEYSKVRIKTNPDEEIAWFDVDEIPELYSDHNEIIEKALAMMRINLASLPIGYQLLPEKFTMTELRLIYETILRKKLDRRNFQRKMLVSGLIYKLDEVSKKFGVKTSALFSFDRKKYEKAMNDGFVIFD